MNLIARVDDVTLTFCVTTNDAFLTAQTEVESISSSLWLHTGVVAIIAGGLVLLLPETKGVPLPDTIDDIEFPNR